MKASSLVSSSGLAALMGLCACMSNGTLFGEVTAAPVEGAEPPSAVAAMTEPPPQAELEPTTAPSNNSEGLRGGGVPLLGRTPERVLRASEPVEPAAISEPEQPGEPELPAAPENPTVVSVTPENGAGGLRDDVQIVIRFSVPMDREATEAAYQSEAVPSDSVSFVWNDDGTELTIVPDDPIPYATGSDPEEVEARRVSFFLSTSALDVEGRPLAQPFESAFSLLRQIEFRLFAVQDRDLSGSFRSNDSYGTGECARAQTNMCVGDVRMGLQNTQYRGFISFELPALPEGALDVSAALSLEITGVAGNPFGGLGGLVLEHARFEEIDLDAFSADALEEVGLIADSGRAGSIVSADVSSALLADQGARDITQYRLRFERATDGDAMSDTLRSNWDTQTMDISYLLP